MTPEGLLHLHPPFRANDRPVDRERSPVGRRSAGDLQPMLGFLLLPQSTPMRIAQIAPPWLPVPPHGYGGTELVVSLLSDGLADRGHSVTLFATGDSRTKARLEYVLERGTGPHVVESLRDEARHALFALRNSSQFDIIHVHSPFMGLTLAALTGRPVVHTVHGWPEMNGIFNLVGDRAWFVAPTKSYASVLPRLPHLELIHHGIDITRYPFRNKKEEFRRVHWSRHLVSDAGF